MQSVRCKQYIEAIKIAAGSVQYKNLSVKNTLIEAIQQLTIYYENSKNKEYLEIALLNIQAYLEMGFEYGEGEKVFNKVLESAGTTRDLEFPKKFYAPKLIKLNKLQVRSMIKKWPASPKQTIKINDLVAEIILKVCSKEKGIYYYECAVTHDVYELVISEEEMFFHDLRRGIFYTFIV